MDELRMVFTPGMPSSEVVSGYVIWSWMSLGERPIHSVATICWLSPMSGMASTGIGFLGTMPPCQLKGAVETPQTTTSASRSMVITLFSRK